jgi:predicted nucleic acid-binding protein
LDAVARAAGRRLPQIDSLLAATALHYGLVVVTRNVRDFERSGVATHNPFSND